MTAHSPRPTLQRAFTVLLAFLLVGSVVAPIAAAGPAAAQEDDPKDNCLYALIGGSDWCHSTEAEITQTQLDQTQQAIETDLHHYSVSEWESQKRYHSLLSNYLEDTGTIASLEAKNAIASEWENGSTEAEATSAARAAIREYYTQQQVQTAESYEKQAAQMRYTHSVAADHEGINDDFVAIHVDDSQGDNSARLSTDYDQPKTNETVGLLNGSEHTIAVPQIDMEFEELGDTQPNYHVQFAIEPFDGMTTTDNDLLKAQTDQNLGAWFTTSGGYTIQNVGNTTITGLESQKIADLWRWRMLWDEIETQSHTMSSNFDSSLTTNLYDALDSGRIDPSDIRSAEGQVRWMSGNDSVTGDRYRQATLSVLGMSNPDLTNASTMVLEYEGYTSQSFSDGTTDRSVVYEDRVNETYQGLLFASDVPSTGFEAGTTYNTEDLNGTPVMFDEESGEEVTFAKGNFTITDMYDSDGNEVESASWEDPKYDTYNADEYVEYVNETKVYRSQMLDEGGDSGSSITFSNPFEDIGTGGALVGLVVIVGAIGIVVVVVLRP